MPGTITPADNSHSPRIGALVGEDGRDHLLEDLRVSEGEGHRDGRLAPPRKVNPESSDTAPMIKSGVLREGLFPGPRPMEHQDDRIWSAWTGELQDPHELSVRSLDHKFLDIGTQQGLLVKTDAGLVYVTGMQRRDADPVGQLGHHPGR